MAGPVSRDKYRRWCHTRRHSGRDSITCLHALNLLLIIIFFDLEFHSNCKHVRLSHSICKQDSLGNLHIELFVDIKLYCLGHLHVKLFVDIKQYSLGNLHVEPHSDVKLISHFCNSHIDYNFILVGNCLLLHDRNLLSNIFCNVKRNEFVNFSRDCVCYSYLDSVFSFVRFSLCAGERNNVRDSHRIKVCDFLGNSYVHLHCISVGDFLGNGYVHLHRNRVGDFLGNGDVHLHFDVNIHALRPT